MKAMTNTDKYLQILENLLTLASMEPEGTLNYLSLSEREDVFHFFESQIKLEQSQNPEGSMTLQGHIDELPG
jgi:hypothetical protein